MLNHSKSLWLGLIALAVAALGPAAPWALADGGMVTLPVPIDPTIAPIGGVAYDVALDAVTGKIYVAGVSSAKTLAGSVLPNGDLNIDFGGGVVLTKVNATIGGFAGRDYCYACAVQQLDGKLVTGGGYIEGKPYKQSYGFALVRYNPNGTLDTTFNTQYDRKGRVVGGGIVKTLLGTNATSCEAIIYGMALQGKKILVTGKHPSGCVALARYTDGGLLDAEFGSGGFVVTTIPGAGTSIALHDDGIVVGASKLNANPVVRFNANGALDTSFGTGGVATFAVPNAPPGAYGTDLSAIAVDPVDQSIVVTGRYGDGQHYRVALARFTAEGDLDETFGSGSGYITFQPWQDGDYSPESVAVDADANIVVAGNSTYDEGASRNVLIARFDEFGAPDNTFNGCGYAEDFPGEAHAMLIQPDGNIVAAGSVIIAGSGSNIDPTIYAAFIVRYLPDGTPDLSF
ncbi:MAG: hypothetical protein NUV77_01835 [Thermoguttaceae bacterium]|jgi:uncharacterized delta-60 repeat protein|nr:hypothetical protein [Thermoguttaceae bacterium]